MDCENNCPGDTDLGSSASLLCFESLYVKTCVWNVCLCVFLGESCSPETAAASLLRERSSLPLPPWPRRAAAGRTNTKLMVHVLLTSLTSPHPSASGFSGRLWRPHGSLLPAPRVGSHLLWSAALHSQSQTAEGAVDLRMRARLCRVRLWQPVQRWDLQSVYMKMCRCASVCRGCQRQSLNKCDVETLNFQCTFT